MNEPKYPTKLFVLGFIFCVIFYQFYLFVPSIILLIIGRNNIVCYYIGCFILLLDLILSFIKQIRIRRTILYDNNPQLDDLRKTLSEGKDITDYVDELIESYKEEDDDE